LPTIRFIGGHLPVQRVGDDDVDVVDPVGVEQLQQDLDDGLTHVGRDHRGQRQADVVDGDGDPHPGHQLRVERVGPQRVVQRVADRGAGIGEPFDRWLGINHPRPMGRSSSKRSSPENRMRGAESLSM
jgi:hypothetical protein